MFNKTEDNKWRIMKMMEILFLNSQNFSQEQWINLD